MVDILRIALLNRNPTTAATAAARKIYSSSFFLFTFIALSTND
jgi:hypothetical protein